MAANEIVIARRFRGPPESGNGGYCAGLLAQRLTGPVEVTLRAPPPLERALRLEVGEGGAEMLDGERVIADARAAVLALAPPRAPSFAEAEDCVTRFAGFQKHVFPQCFVCGPDRAAGDGLRIFTGPTEDGRAVAAPFVPDASLADPANGLLRPALAWAALDCPGYFAAAGGETAVLGRMIGELVRLPAVGERCVVIGWPLGRDGRKISAGTALYDESGALLGLTQQTWIALKQ